MLFAGADGALATGDAARCGVPARPSRPEDPDGGCFCKEAGAAPSKSMSSKFSALLCGTVPPVTAAAAIGFSRASCFCSL